MVAGQILFKSMPMTRLVLNHFLFNPLGFEEKDIMCIPVLVSGLFRIEDNVEDILSNYYKRKTSILPNATWRWRCLDWMMLRSLFSSESFLFGDLRPSTRSIRCAFVLGAPSP